MIMQTININDASSKQLALLLGLRPDEADRFVAGRPYKDLFSMRRALPVRVALRVRSFDVPKIDLNGVSEDDLVSRLGLSQAGAREVAKRRPFYFLNEVRRLKGLTAQEI